MRIKLKTLGSVYLAISTLTALLRGLRGTRGTLRSLLHTNDSIRVPHKHFDLFPFFY